MKNICLSSFVFLLTLFLSAPGFAGQTSTPVFQGGTNSGGAGSASDTVDSFQSIPDVIVINAICEFIYDDLPACVFQTGAQCDYQICLAFDPDYNPEEDNELPDFPVAP